MSEIFRYVVHVDDQWHTIDLSGAVLHVDCRNYGWVEMWALHGDGAPVAREFRAFGTGQELPDEPLIYRGTALTPAGPMERRGDLVWHLMERIAGDPAASTEPTESKG